MRARNKNSASTASTSIGTTSRASPTSTTSPSLNSRRHLITMSSSMTTSCRLACRRRTSSKRGMSVMSQDGDIQVSKQFFCIPLSNLSWWNSMIGFLIFMGFCVNLRIVRKQEDLAWWKLLMGGDIQVKYNKLTYLTTLSHKHLSWWKSIGFLIGFQSTWENSVNKKTLHSEGV